MTSPPAPLLPGLEGPRAPIAVLLLTAATIAAACGDGSGREDRSRGAGEPPAAAGGPTTEAEGSAEAVTFADHVAPILHRNCTDCHRRGGPAPFPLLSYEDARERADLIARMTRTRTMPPWLPEPGYGRFEGERRLTEEQIATIQRWAERGTPRGDPSKEPEPPERESGWTLGEPDLVVEMPRAFRLRAAGPDVFRNFVIPVPLEDRRWVRTAELRPGNPKAVHHAMMMVDPTRSSRRIAAQDSAPGFDGMITRSQARSPGGFFLAWTPGRVPSMPPQGLSWRLEPGTDMLVQLHLRPTGDRETIRAKVGLYFTDRPPERIPFVLRLTSQTIDIPAGDSAWTFTDRYELPVEAEVLGIYPHAHYLGKRIHARALLPDGSERWLIRIDDWNFNWQDTYRYAEPVELPAGTVLRTTFTYDNSASNPLNPHSPPERVTYGPRSTDEMGDLWIQVVVRDSADLARLRRDFGRKDLEEQVAGWRHTFTLDPDDAYANYNLGALLQAEGETERAAEHYRRALRDEPAHAQAHYNLALILEDAGRADSALHHYRRAAEAAPDYADAHNNLGNLLRARGRSGDALAAYRRAVEADPGHAFAHNNLANLLARRGGEPDSALRHYRRAITIRPDYPEARFNLGLLLEGLGREREALAHYRETARLRPEWPEPRTTAAWILSTHPDSSVREPAEAVRLAREAAELAGGDGGEGTPRSADPRTLGVLAAAYAAAGRYEAAVATAERAVSRAEARGEAGLARTLGGLLEIFRDGRPYVRQ